MKQLSILSVAIILAGCSSIQVEDHTHVQSAGWITEVPANSTFVRPIFQYTNQVDHRKTQYDSAIKPANEEEAQKRAEIEMLKNQVAELEEQIALMERQLTRFDLANSNNDVKAEVENNDRIMNKKDIQVVDFSTIYDENNVTALQPKVDRKSEKSAQQATIANQKSMQEIDIVKVFSDRESAFELVSILSEAGDNDFFVSNNNDEWFVYLGRYLTVSAANRRIDMLNDIGVFGAVAVTAKGRIDLAEIV